MNELEQALIGDSAAAPAAHILERLGDEFVHALAPGAPRTICEELWHLAFWQQLSLGGVPGNEAAYPVNASLGFRSEPDVNLESWDQLRKRFLDACEKAAAISCAGRPIVEALAELAGHVDW